MKDSNIINTAELTAQIKKSLLNQFSSELEIEVYPAVLNKSQLKKFLNLEYKTIDYLIALKDFPKINFGKGKQLRFPKKSVENWLDKNYTKLNNIF